VSSLFSDIEMFSRTKKNRQNKPVKSVISVKQPVGDASSDLEWDAGDFVAAFPPALAQSAHATVTTETVSPVSSEAER